MCLRGVCPRRAGSRRFRRSTCGPTCAWAIGPAWYFFSLDAGNAIAVKAARAFLNLPYYLAGMSVSRTGNEITYRSASRSGGPAEFNATYEPLGMPFAPVEGTLEYFLTERYCLYHRDRGGVPYRLEIHHPPWSLQVAKATIGRNTMATAAGLSVSGEPAMLHFAQRQDVVAWMPSRIRSRRPRELWRELHARPCPRLAPPHERTR